MKKAAYKTSGIFLLVITTVGGLTACGGGGGSDTEEDAAISLTDPWIINTTDRSTTMFESSTTNTGVLFDIQVAEQQTINDIDYIYIESSGIPRYDVTITDDIVTDLNSRPRAGTDFAGAVTTVSSGQVVVFGEDIGYNSSTENCDDTGGAGYWPPGPGCPINIAKTEYLPAEPEPTTQECESGLGTIGLMVNGTSIYNWGDGQSVSNGLWYTLAPVAEQYDVDICGGHAARGDYHHHFYTSCLANLVGDDSTSHSPIYGFAADGYPVYGPYESADTLAVSGWEIRDYGSSIATGGCNTPGERTCVLNNDYDVSQGVENTITQGPDIDDAVTTLSGNTLAATAGYYREDYYFAGYLAIGDQLDQHNGHDNDDGRGYHYHITLLDDGLGNLTPSFPYTIGPRFYGEVPDNGVTRCDDGSSAPGPPP